MIVFYFFLIAVAVSALFLCEESTAARIAVGMPLGIAVLQALHPYLPGEWVEALPTLGHGFGLRAGRSPRMLAASLLALAIGYPIAACVLYPLRNRLMAAFDRRYGSKKR